MIVTLRLCPVRPRLALSFCAAFPLLLALGCNFSRRIEAPALSPEEAGKAALAEYDTNKDGFLDEKELERCPCLRKLAKEKNNHVTAQDITDRLAAWKATGIAQVGSVPSRVVDAAGNPLVGATVTFVPEPFLGSGFKPSSGVTNERGEVQLQSADGLPGCRWGFYKVQVSHKDDSGKELIPAEYNANTKLGCEVSADGRLSPEDFTFVVSQ